MTGEGHQISAQGRHIDRYLRHGLRRVDDHDGTDGVGLLGNLPDGIDRPQHVRGQRQRDDLGALINEPLRLSLLEVEAAVISDVEPPQGGTGALTNDLPRNQVGVVLHHRNDDLVIRSETLTQGVRAQIKSFRRVRQSHHFLRARRPDKTREAFPPTLISLGGLQPELVHGPCNVGVVTRVVLAQSVNDNLGFLGSVSRVEVRQRVIPHPGGQDGKVFPDLLDVVAHN